MFVCLWFCKCLLSRQVPKMRTQQKFGPVIQTLVGGLFSSIRTYWQPIPWLGDELWFFYHRWLVTNFVSMFCYHSCNKIIRISSIMPKLYGKTSHCLFIFWKMSLQDTWELEIINLCIVEALIFHGILGSTMQLVCTSNWLLGIFD